MDGWQFKLANFPSWVRISLFFLTWILAWLPMGISIARRIGWTPFDPLSPAQKLPLLAPLYLLAPILLAIDFGGSWREYGWHFDLQNWPIEVTDLMGGIILGLLGLAIVFGMEIVTGLAVYNRSKIAELWPLLLPILLLALWISGTEELLFRGWLTRELSRDYPYWWAAAIANAIFALLHLVWERQQTLPQIPGLWLLGMVLSYACGLGGSLSLAIGLHAGWVWGLSAIDSAGLISYQSQQHWFTGANAQPLAGGAGILCLLLTGALLWGIAGI
jgi:uncharacterized protein